MSNRYRGKHEFQVTVLEPCPICNRMVPEREVKKGKREQYVYGAGWLTILACCEDCWSTAKTEHEAKGATSVKSGYSSYEYGD